MKYLTLLVLIFLVLSCISCHKHFDFIHHIQNKLNIFKHTKQNPTIPTQCNKLTLQGQPKAYAYSGYLKAISNTSNSVLGFTFYGSQLSNGDTTQFGKYPTIIWLQGGPGYSSQFGNFIELGPYLPINTTNQGIQWVYNTQSLNKDYNLLFIDTPIGVGMSYIENASDAPTDQMTYAQQLYFALKNLYYDQNGCFNVLSMTQTPLFIFGESYGAKFAVSIADYIMMQTDPNINFKGIALGDGFINPDNIVSQMGYSAYALGLVNQQERSTLESYILQAQWDIRFENWQDAFSDYMNIYSSLLQTSGLTNLMNFREVTSVQITDLDVLFSNPALMNMYQMIQGYPFHYFNQSVMQNFSIDYMQSDCFTKLEKILMRGKPVMIYQGQNDALVCPLCQQYQADNLQYQYQSQFQSSIFTPWYQTGSNTTVLGYTKAAGNLEYWTVNRAGAFVPLYQPASAYQLFKKFIQSHC